METPRKEPLKSLGEGKIKKGFQEEVILELRFER